MKSPPPAKTRNKSSPPTSTPISSITGSLIDGVTFGIGSSIGHNVINNISRYFTKDDKPDCSDILKKLNDCKEKHTECSDIFIEYQKCIK